MPRGFDKSTVTLAAATAQSLAALLAAEGYAGSVIGAFLELEDVNSLGDVYHGGDSTVSATTGRPLTIYTRISQHPRQPVDPARIWLFSTAGGDVGCTFEPY